MQPTKSYYSIIDIGSNSIRLVIYKKENSLRLHEVENVKTVARLRNYLDEDDLLTEEGMNKLIVTLASFKEVIKTYDLTEFICIATATIRQARNQEEIRKRVLQATGWNLRILSESEEAYYGYLAVVNSTTITEGITVDIGGGSTELTLFKDRKLIKSHSFPFGGLTLKQFFDGNEPVDMQIENLREFLYETFNELDWIKDQSIPLIGIGGSARNLVQIHQNRVEYPLAGLHQYYMAESSLRETCSYISSLEKRELEKLEGLSKTRTDTIVPATFVFLTLYEVIKAKGFVLSRKGLRDGFFYELLADSEENLYPNVLKDSILDLIYEYARSFHQIEHVSRLSQQFFDALVPDSNCLEEKDRIYLRLGCYTYNIGSYIDTESSSQHTFYLLANRTIDGLLHVNRLKMALIASFKNRTVFRQYLTPFNGWLTKQEEEKFYTLGALLKLIYSLDATKRQIVKEMQIELKENTVHLTIYCDQHYLPEQYEAEKQKKHLEKALDKHIQLTFI